MSSSSEDGKQFISLRKSRCVFGRGFKLENDGHKMWLMLHNPKLGHAYITINIRIVGFCSEAKECLNLLCLTPGNFHSFFGKQSMCSFTSGDVF